MWYNNRGNIHYHERRGLARYGPTMRHVDGPFDQGLRLPEKRASDSRRLGDAGIPNLHSPWQTEYNPKLGLYRGKGPRAYKKTDERLKEIVCDILTDDPDVDASGIDVNVNNAEVILTGTVPDRFSKRFAARLVESVSGVCQVENRLRIEEMSDKGRVQTVNLRSKTKETFR